LRTERIEEKTLRNAIEAYLYVGEYCIDKGAEIAAQYPAWFDSSRASDK
jgi:hypothetical protein